MSENLTLDHEVRMKVQQQIDLGIEDDERAEDEEYDFKVRC